ncbi:MAG: hypothetical protein Q4C61_13060 [Lachnospiraceae bacterium]|nr:hypothetical protein [Lachnospiraceae bacterium]
MKKETTAKELPKTEGMTVPERMPGEAAAEAPEGKAPDVQGKPPKGSKEEAYEWLIQHHVTARAMDIVIAVCIILLVIVVVLGMK